jgi:hypothetical protein
VGLFIEMGSRDLHTFCRNVYFFTSQDPLLFYPTGILFVVYLSFICGDGMGFAVFPYFLPNGFDPPEKKLMFFFQTCFLHTYFKYIPNHNKRLPTNMPAAASTKLSAKFSNITVVAFSVINNAMNAGLIDHLTFLRILSDHLLLFDSVENQTAFYDTLLDKDNLKNVLLNIKAFQKARLDGAADQDDLISRIVDSATLPLVDPATAAAAAKTKKPRAKKNAPVADAPVADAAVAAADADEAPVAAADEKEKEKKVRKPRAKKNADAAEPDADADVAPVAPVAISEKEKKVRKPRAKKNADVAPEPDADVPVSVAAAEKEKKVRKPRAKKNEAAETSDTDADLPTEVPVGSPKKKPAQKPVPKSKKTTAAAEPLTITIPTVHDHTDTVPELVSTPIIERVMQSIEFEGTEYLMDEEYIVYNLHGDSVGKYDTDNDSIAFH